MTGGLLLDETELIALSGGYRRAREQLRELVARGYYRATRSAMTGKVVLTRAHVLAVDAAGQPAAGVGSAGPNWKKAA